MNRREFLGHSAVTGAALPFFRTAEQDSGEERSGLITGKPRPTRYRTIKGFLSSEQVRWHHESHYGGALRAFNGLDADPTGRHRTRVAKANSVLLHELYFDNMSAKPGDPGRATNEALKGRFGSVERWIEDFRAAGRSCRGWAVLCWHPVNGKLYNVCSDSHDDGPVWSGVPLVVADVYEHSYYIDYQNRKGDYVDAFTDHVDWAEVERRVRASLG